MEALAAPTEDREAARRLYGRSKASTKADIPDDKYELVALLTELVGNKSLVEVASDVLLNRLNAGSREARFSKYSTKPKGEQQDQGMNWTAQKLGKQLGSLSVYAKEPKRTNRNSRRIYPLDGEAVRTIAKRYGLTK
jgi:hypothetical protein